MTKALVEELRARATKLHGDLEAHNFDDANALLKDLLDHIEAISSAAADLADLAEGFIPLCDQNSKLEKACKAVRAALKGER